MSSRHRFEPARLLLGVVLMGIAVAYVMDALGEWEVPTGVLLALVPLALLMAAFTLLMTYVARRWLARRRKEVPPSLGEMPEGDLRRGHGSGGGARRDRDDD